MSPHLTDAEIAEITEPLTQGAARCRYIRKVYGVTVKEKPNGQPLVGRAEFEAALTSRRPQAAPRATGGNVTSLPDWKSAKGFGARP